MEETIMSIDKWNSVVCRVAFVVAMVFMGIAAVEKVANLLGYSVIRGTYTAGRLFELATLLVIFVIALLLRQIREELKRNK
jgi:hypothetical protein